MTDANEMCDSVMVELNPPARTDAGETKEEQGSFSCHEEAASDDLPPSLLSYFEASKSRAAACERLILEDLEDFTASHHTEVAINFPIELSKDMMKPNEQVIFEAENENKTDDSLLPAPTKTQALFAPVSACPSNEGGTREYLENEKYLKLKISEYDAEREKHHCEDMQKKEQRKQREIDFQEELRKIMEAEKLQQRDLELMERRAQEKLEQELLLQQELISDLQKRVQQERRRIEEEEEERKIKCKEEKRKREEEDQRKRKEEGEKRKREEEDQRKRQEEGEKRKREEEDQRKRQEEGEKRKREEEDQRKRKEEVRKREEEDQRKRKEEGEKRKREEEDQRKRQEEGEKRKREEEDQRKRQEEGEKRKREEEDQRKRKEEVRKREEEDQRKRKEEGEKRKREEEDQRKRKEEGEKRKREEEDQRKRQEEGEKRKREEEDQRKRQEERTKIEEEEQRKIVEMRLNEEEDRRQKEEEQRRKSEEEKNKMEEEERTKEEEERRQAEEEERKTREKEEKQKEREKERQVVEERKMMEVEEATKLKDELRKREEEERKKRGEEEVRITEELEVREKQEVERKSEEERGKPAVERKGMDEERGDDEERRHGEENKDAMRKGEDMKTKEGEQIESREKEMRRRKEEREYRNTEEELECEVDNRRMDHGRKTKEEVKKHHEKDGTRNIQADKRHDGEEGREDEENITTEERTLEGEEGGRERKQDTENEGRIERMTELREKKTERDSVKSQSPSPSVSTASSESAQHLDKNISQASSRATADQQGPSVKPSCCSLPANLPERTEQKRLSWMKDCTPWSKLSLQNRRKQKGSVRSRRGPRRLAEGGGLPPLCPDILLQSTGWKSLQEVTTVTMEDLPGCSLSTLVQCTQLRSLTLRRCGLKSLEGIRQLEELRYIDLQENDISFVDCENMSSLQVLRLARNKLTSIHGLCGADNLDVLDLSHNSITRIAGLESLRRLQRLSVNHNQLISTKGLRDVYTLLHLDCSHNHLASVEGLENSALLHTLDLRANSLTEPPSLNNQVLLRELLLDDNSVSSLQGLTARWLPLMQRLSAAQNRITQLPSMLDFVSLEYLDLRFNCLSELQNVCENLEGCQLLQEVHLTGNPLQQESGWRSTLQKAVPALRAIDSQETDSSRSPPAGQHVSMASGCFVTFCQVQLQQTRDLQQRHSRELSDASSPLDAVKSSCRYFTLTLKLAEDQRFAHEYGDTTVSDELWAVGQTTSEKTLDVDNVTAETLTDCPRMESTNKIPAVIPSKDSIKCNYWSFEETPAAESRCDTFDSVTMGPTTGPTANSGGLHFFTAKGKTTSFNIEKPPVSNHRDLYLKNMAAVVIQQRWREYRQRCGNLNAPAIAEKGGERGGGDGGKPVSGPSYINRSAAGQDFAATVIQAFWRGFTLRRRLASALAAVTCPDAGDDDTFEEVDVDEFVFDEAALERHCKPMLSEDSPPRHYPASEQTLSLKPPGPCLDPSQDILPPPLVWSPKQAWVAGEHVDSAAQRISPESSNRSKSPASSSVLSGLSERSEKILEEWGFADSHTALQMLRRAQKMKPKKQRQKKHLDPSARLALHRNCNYQLRPEEARNRPARHTRNYVKVGEAELGLQQAEKTERVKQEQAQQWLHTQAAQSDRHSESEHFLPEMNSSILNGGRVQLVADPAYADRLHHASGLWANSSLAAQPCKVSSYPRRNSCGHARKEVPSPKRVTSAPSKKERISFRDNPVQLSGGWGGGKKSDRVHK